MALEVFIGSLVLLDSSMVLVSGRLGLFLDKKKGDAHEKKDKLFYFYFLYPWEKGERGEGERREGGRVRTQNLLSFGLCELVFPYLCLENPLFIPKVYGGVCGLLDSIWWPS